MSLEPESDLDFVIQCSNSCLNKAMYHHGQQWNAYTFIHNKEGPLTAQVLFLKII